MGDDAVIVQGTAAADAETRDLQRDAHVSRPSTVPAG